MPRYIAVGGAAIDHIVLPDGQRMPPQCGGSAFYAAVGMRVWNPDVGVVSLVSSGYPQGWIDSLAEAGIDVRGIQRSGSSMGIEGKIIYNADGTRTLAATEGLMGLALRLFPGLIATLGKRIWRSVCPGPTAIPEVYHEAVAAHFAPIEYSRQAACLEALSGHVKLAIVDPPPLLPGQPHGTIPAELANLSLADVVLPSEQELTEYFGDGVSPEAGARRLMARGAKSVVVKLGVRGALVPGSDSRQWRITPIYRTQAIDVTGAGDSFCGGFLVGLDETGDLFQAALYGAVSASFVVEGFGVNYALKRTRAEAEARLKALRDQVRK
jgi:sugar/nucleoside kinase (ribokinase family)